jgi:hypothetical protein
MAGFEEEDVDGMMAISELMLATINRYLFILYRKNSDTPAILIKAPITSMTFTFCLKIR